jgi:FkbH-like protein
MGDPRKADTAMELDPKPLLAISATFTADPIEDTIAFWARKFGLPFDIQFAPYNQVFQQLLGSGTLLTSNRDGINVLLIRLEDWQGCSAGATPVRSHVEQSSREFVGALRDAAQRTAVPYVVCLFCAASPAVANDPVRSAELSRAEAFIASELKDAPTVHVVTSADAAKIYDVKDYYSAHTDDIGHVPYTDDYFTALGTIVFRRVWALRARPYKVIALDCDGTLWKGICGEDGADGVRFDANRTFLQEFMVKQSEAGMLLCICSKNSQQDVFGVFDRRRDEMPLKREHIVSWRVNWAAKSDNLRSLASELGLGVDSVIMLDDNPIECAEIEANCPGVMALQLPSDEEKIPTFLCRVWAFDHLKVTSEDRNRTEHYQANAQRETVRTASLTMEDFLRGLKLEIAIAPVQANQLERVAQLTQRTNQFNVSGVRRTLGELERFCDGEEGRCLVVQVRDRFGDYGLVGALIYTKASDTLVVDSFMLSCRALGRKVEHRMLSELGSIALRLRAAYVDIQFIPTPKNKPARDFLESFGSEFRNAGDHGILFRFPSEFAAYGGDAVTGKRLVLDLEDARPQSELTAQ